MGSRDNAIVEASMRHQLCMLMAHERQLQRSVAAHPDIDPAYFDDLHLALTNCTREFLRIQPSTIKDWDAAIESMAPERG